MGNAVLPHILRDDKLLTPQIINENFQRLLEQQKQALARRYLFDEIVVRFKPGATNSTPAAQMGVTIRPPENCTIIARELYVYGDDGDTFALSTSSMDDLEVEGNGSTTVAVARDVKVQRQGAAFTVSLGSDAASWTADAAWAVLHVAYDRFASPPSATLDPVLDTDDMDDAATKVNAAITALDGVNTTLAAREGLQRIDCIAYGDNDFTSIPSAARDIAVPAAGGTIARVEGNVVADSGASVGFELLDEGGASLGSVTLNGVSGNSRVIGRFTPAETLPDASCAAASDYSIRLSYSGSGTVYQAYVLVFWE